MPPRQLTLSLWLGSFPRHSTRPALESRTTQETTSNCCFRFQLAFLRRFILTPQYLLFPIQRAARIRLPLRGECTKKKPRCDDRTGHECDTRGGRILAARWIGKRRYCRPVLSSHRGFLLVHHHHQVEPTNNQCTRRDPVNDKCARGDTARKSTSQMLSKPWVISEFFTAMISVCRALSCAYIGTIAVTTARVISYTRSVLTMAEAWEYGLQAQQRLQQ